VLTFFFSLENKDRRTYIRAKQDSETLHFHAAEPPPCYARWSDEGHPLCAADNVENGFTKDMLTKTGEAGQHTTRANVFAREGQFFWEAKVVSSSPEANKNNKGVPLQTVDDSDKSSCQRGSIKVGFARREQDMTLPIGFQAYSYSAMRTAGNKYGSVQHRQRMAKIIGKEHDGPQPGDVIGIMITLPSLEIHEQVVKGTYNPEDHPELSYGPVALKDLKKKPGAKKMGKSKSAVAKGKEKATDTPEPEHFRDAKRRQLYTERGLTIPPTLDILRDRNPFPYKGNLLYFECPNYTPRPDLMNAESKGRTMNPDTGKSHETVEESHPCHELPWLRTLPGSKIEVWVNGEYLGIAWEHLLAFLPPASYIEKSARACTLYGDVDDGLLGYYPALTHYGGGTVEAKFDGPWWYGYDKAAFPEARPFGERYEEQIVEDFVSDMVDEATVDINYGEGYMKAMVASKRKAEEQK
jgi:COMPASS component BRE2